jgi:hypothetical protein
MNENKKNNQLAKAIYSAVAYFDIFDYPLTLEEIWQNLYFETPAAKKFLASEVLAELKNNEKLKKQIETKNDFYFFSGREKIIETRLWRYGLAEKKYKIALRIAKIFKFIPFIEMIAICNSLAFANSRENSDIDFFIVCQKKRIWLARFFTVAIIKFLNLRPKPNNTKDKICLSFFISEEFLNLEKIAYPDDVHFQFWLNQIHPLYTRAEIYQKFSQANQWSRSKLPNLSAPLPNLRRKIKSVRFNFLNFFNWSVFDCLETLAKFFEMKILPAYLKNIANLNGRVIVSDQILKFHPRDRRLEYKELFLKKVALFE